MKSQFSLSGNKSSTTARKDVSCRHLNQALRIDNEQENK